MARQVTATIDVSLVMAVLAFGALGAMPAIAQTDSPADAKVVDFNRDIRPLLADRCFICHGPDEDSNDSGLRLDLSSSALGPLPSGTGRAIVPGDPAQSELLRRITSSDEFDLMPPPDSRLKLAATEIQLLRRWIQEGAAFETHWAFRPLPQRIPLPELPDA